MNKKCSAGRADRGEEDSCGVTLLARRVCEKHKLYFRSSGPDETIKFIKRRRISYVYEK